MSNGPTQLAFVQVIESRWWNLDHQNSLMTCGYPIYITIDNRYIYKHETSRDIQITHHEHQLESTASVYPGRCHRFSFSDNAQAQEFMDLLASWSWFTVRTRPDNNRSTEEILHYLAGIREEWVSELNWNDMYSQGWKMAGCWSAISGEMLSEELPDCGSKILQADTWSSQGRGRCHGTPWTDQRIQSEWLWRTCYHSWRERRAVVFTILEQGVGYESGASSQGLQIICAWLASH